MTLDKKIEKAIEPLVNMYSDIEMKLILELAEHFMINDEFINSDYWRIQKLDEMGAFNSKVIDIIANTTKRSPEAIKNALKQVYNDTLDLDTLRSAYTKGKLRIKPKEIVNNVALKAIFEHAYNEEINRFIKMSEKIEQATRDAYLNIVETGYIETATGVRSYQESIRNSLNKLAEDGIDTLDYEYDLNGTRKIRRYSVEGAVRREILTGARQLSGNLNAEMIDKTQCEYVIFSEHIDCRPTHFDWQGTIVKTEDWKQIADYGDVAGIYGINCRHYVEPYFGDKRGSELKQYSKNAVDNAYKESQKQRYLERGVRAWKRKAMISKAQGDTYEYKRSVLKTHEWQKKLDDFSNSTSKIRKYDNEYVSGFKDAKVNIIPPKSIVNKLEKVNIVADDSIGKIPTNLLERNVNQFKKLSEKYNMEEFYKNQTAIYKSPNTQKYIGAIGYNNKMTHLTINSSYKYFYDKQYLVELVEEQVKAGEFMPCSEKNYDIYTMTHEFGHTLEMKMFKDKYPNGNNISYSHFCSSVKDDIINIAINKNPHIDISTAMSAYGHDIKTQEFFAEAFANMELGKSNEMGKALKEYLKREGIL